MDLTKVGKTKKLIKHFMVIKLRKNKETDRLFEGDK
jgi:hypothetical protein